MPALAEPAKGFSLADFPPLDGVQENEVVVPATDGKAVETPPPVEAAPVETAQPETKEPETPDRPDGEATDKAVEPEGPTSFKDAFEDPDEAEKKAETARVATEKKAQDEAAEKAKAEPEKAAKNERDADLKVEWGPNTHSSTRKKFDAATALTRQARDERDAIKAERDAAVARAIAAEEKAKGIEPPKELVEKLKNYEERIRELDITKDPALVEKYDRKIEANNKTIIEVLKAQAYDQTKLDKGDGKVEYVTNPAAIPKLLAEGLTLKNLKPLIDSLEKADLVEEADVIRQAVQQNRQIAKDKAAEVESWKGDYSKRQQQREQETKTHTENRQKTLQAETDRQYTAGREELAKHFPYIKEPAAPLPTDPPATAQAKQKAIDEYNAVAAQISEEVKGLNPASAPPEKFMEVVGKINANAILAIAFKHQVAPRVLKEMAAKDARIKELEGRLGKIDNAGRISRAQSAPGGGEVANNGRPEPKTLEEAFTPPPGF